MNDSFIDYIHRLELIAFFSGYPLIYATVILIAGNRQLGNHLKKSLVSLLPYSYALVATLYLGFEVNNLYPKYSIEDLKTFGPHPFLLLWGMMAVLFWIPVFARRAGIALLHSLVFFILLVSDIFFSEADSSGTNHIVRNDMKLYTASVILNSISFVTVAGMYFFLRWFRSVRKASRLLH